MQSAPLVVRFSTDNVPPPDRIATWRELIFQSSLEVEILPTDDEPFHATATVRQLPGLRSVSGTSPAASYRRAVHKVDAEDVTASLNRREAEIDSYDAFLLPCGDRASIDLPHNSRFTALRLPRAAIASNVSDF